MTDRGPKSPELSGTQSLKQTVREFKDELVESASDAATTVEARVNSGLSDSRAAALDVSENVKGRTACEVADTAAALKSAGDQVGEGSIQQQLLHEAADGLSQIAGRLESKNLSEFASDVSDFGRNHPLAFLSGAALAGFAIARFARSTERQANDFTRPSASRHGSQPSPSVAASAPATSSRRQDLKGGDDV